MHRHQANIQNVRNGHNLQCIVLMIGTKLFYFIIGKFMEKSNQILLAIVNIVDLYQKELIRLFKMNPNELHPEFKRQFADYYGQIKIAMTDNLLQNELVSACNQMQDFLHNNRLSHTSTKTRKISTHRVARNLPTNNQMIEAAYCKTRDCNRKEVRQIMQSYQIDRTPEVHMMWRDAYRRQVILGSPSVNNSTMEVLADTIPHIQVSIKRLSLQKQVPASKDKQAETDRPRRRHLPFLF